VSAHTLNASDVRHYWDNVNGQIVEGWELAVEWNRQGGPTHWRALHTDFTEDRRLLFELGIQLQDSAHAA
jgi:hypothetical protein